MAKKSKSKKNKNLRREIEMLKAQLSIDNTVEMKKYESKAPTVSQKILTDTHASRNSSFDTNFEIIKSDLLKSFVLALFGFATIAMLWAYERGLFSNFSL